MKNISPITLKDTWQCPWCKSVYGPKPTPPHGFAFYFAEKTEIGGFETCVNCVAKALSWLFDHVLGEEQGGKDDHRDHYALGPKTMNHKPSSNICFGDYKKIKEGNMECHRIIVGETKNVSPGYYYVKLRCGIIARNRDIATFYNLDDARKFGKEKAKELKLELEDKTKEQK